MHHEDSTLKSWWWIYMQCLDRGQYIGFSWILPADVVLQVWVSVNWLLKCQLWKFVLLTLDFGASFFFFFLSLNFQDGLLKLAFEFKWIFFWCKTISICNLIGMKSKVLPISKESALEFYVNTGFFSCYWWSPAISGSP